MSIGEEILFLFWQPFSQFRFETGAHCLAKQGMPQILLSLQNIKYRSSVPITASALNLPVILFRMILLCIGRRNQDLIASQNLTDFSSIHSLSHHLKNSDYNGRRNRIDQQMLFIFRIPVITIRD